jgi:hypothetical protein
MTLCDSNWIRSSGIGGERLDELSRRMHSSLSPAPVDSLEIPISEFYSWTSILATRRGWTKLKTKTRRRIDGNIVIVTFRDFLAHEIIVIYGRVRWIVNSNRSRFLPLSLSLDRWAEREIIIKRMQCRYLRTSTVAQLTAPVSELWTFAG